MKFSLAGVMQDFGLFADARERYRDVLKSSRNLGDRCSESRCLAGIGLTSHFLGDSREALDALHHALFVAQEIQEKYVEAFVHDALGQVHAARDQFEPAAEHYRKSVEFNRQIGHDFTALKPLAGLALVNLKKGNPDRALELVDDILGAIEKDGSCRCDPPLFVFLTCYKVLQACQDARAGALLATASNLLDTRAAGIKESEFRISFLENVPVNCEIQDACLAEIKA
jgi:tetratricopeptide (TPR) repeat protein